MSHPNSRKVTIYRLTDFITRAQSGQIQDFLSQSKDSLGAYFKHHSSPAIGTGLTLGEIGLLMPIVLQVSEEDKTFRAEVHNWFCAIDTKVDFTKGAELEIGLEADNNKPVSKNNMPLNITDYIRYRHACEHPQVALDYQTGHGNQLKKYYIFDPVKAQKSKDKELEDQDTAMLKYLELKKDEGKLDILLTLLGEDIRQYARPQDKQDKLKTIVDKRPSDFMTAVNTKNLDEVAALRQMVTTGVVSVVLGSYYVASSNTPLGKNEDEAVKTLMNPDNKELYMLLMGNTQEALKKGRKAAK